MRICMSSQSSIDFCIFTPPINPIRSSTTSIFRCVRVNNCRIPRIFFFAEKKNGYQRRLREETGSAFEKAKNFQKNRQSTSRTPHHEIFVRGDQKNELPRDRRQKYRAPNK